MFKHYLTECITSVSTRTAHMKLQSMYHTWHTDQWPCKKHVSHTIHINRIAAPEIVPSVTSTPHPHSHCRQYSLDTEHIFLFRLQAIYNISTADNTWNKGILLSGQTQRVLRKCFCVSLIHFVYATVRQASARSYIKSYIASIFIDFFRFLFKHLKTYNPKHFLKTPCARPESSSLCMEHIHIFLFRIQAIFSDD